MCPKHFFRDECEVKKHVYLDLSVARIDNWGSVHVMSNWILLCNSRSSIEEIIYLLIILMKNGPWCQESKLVPAAPFIPNQGNLPNANCPLADSRCNLILIIWHVASLKTCGYCKAAQFPGVIGLDPCPILDLLSCAQAPPHVRPASLGPSVAKRVWMNCAVLAAIWKWSVHAFICVCSDLHGIFTHSLWPGCRRVKRCRVLTLPGRILLFDYRSGI